MKQRKLNLLFQQLVLAALPVQIGAALVSCSGSNSGTASGTGGSTSEGTQPVATGGSGAVASGGSATQMGGGSSTSGTTTTGAGGFLGTVAMTGGTSSSATSANSTGVGGFLGTVVMTGGTSAASATTSKGVGGFLGTVVMTGGTSAAPATTAKGIGGFLGTVVMTGGTSATATSTSSKGVGGFLGTVAMTGGTSATGTGNTVECPAGATNTNGGVAAVGCGTDFCVIANTSAADAGIPAAATVDITLCSALCGQFAMSCESVGMTTTPNLVKCNPGCTGRRPTGLNPVPAEVFHDLARYFSEVAHLEAASVAAFRALGRQLTAHGAPRALRRAARRAARDEIRHARITRELAVRYGGSYVPPQLTPKQAPDIETIARENATEGCVRETFGALLATYQANQATDPQVRQVMQVIARDETRHAALAWRIAKWAESRMSTAAQHRVAAAQRACIQQLFDELSYADSVELQSTAGVPSRSQARELALALDQQLWHGTRSQRQVVGKSQPRIQSQLAVA